MTGHRYGLMWALFGVPHERALPIHKTCGRLAYYTLLVHVAITVHLVYVCIYMYIYVYMWVCMCVCMHVGIASISSLRLPC
jgi:hypothetical protein